MGAGRVYGHCPATGHFLPDAPRSGIVVNLGEHRLYYFSPNGVKTYAIGVGREGWETPLGTTSIVRKMKNPIWFPPDSIRKEHPELPKAVRAGPANCLNFLAVSHSVHY